uniref:Purine or other phosphorylase family protein n=1 Tax=uncultured marine crenarchaeote E37-7F TaxID=907717 RepID=G9BAQ7_9ARCH|nr:purine or other phosphorylase family protein [uncultured marine crenarchaeote E37-7F]
MKSEEITLFSGKLSKKAVLNPTDLKISFEEINGSKRSKVPKYCILSFFGDMTTYLKEKYDASVSDILGKERRISFFNYKDIDIVHIYPGIGAPSAGLGLETMIALGAEHIIFIGEVGTLTENIGRGEIILPNKALRDEGTSFHYQKPSRYAYPNKVILNYTRRFLKENNISFHEGGTWTTDAPFRETHEKVKQFFAEGCLCVEMEASALFSIAHFRKKQIGGLFIAEDSVAGETWNPRRTPGDTEQVEKDRKRLLEYALASLFLLNMEIKNNSEY